MNTTETTLPKGSITFANESRFQHAHLSEPLTAYSAGWKDPQNLQGLLDFVAPPVPVARRFEFRRSTPSEFFYSEDDDVRAIGGSFKRVGYTGDAVQSKTLNKGLTIRVDHDEEVGPDWRERYVGLLVQRLLRNELRRALAAMEDASTPSPQVWSPGANPDADLRAELSFAAQDTGLRPNRMLWAPAAWDQRQNAYDGQESVAAVRVGSFGPEELARKLFVEELRLFSPFHHDGERLRAMLENSIYLFYGRNGLHRDEPSTLKRFYTPTEDGHPFRVYVEEHAKYTDISVEHYSQVVLTNPDGLRHLTISA
ncbi:MAG: hypothetical protein E1N59_2277 [Puniceicoccaceae bacterium 5H]|nr:MAG: hypothetical protein E1N59_2277 [Puniceicoccaceae bacterium 5H]